MIKKIIFTFTLFCLVLSCGKKGDPVYKESNKKDKTQNIEKSIV